MDFRAMVVNDLQCPLHDQRAFDVACQVGADFKPDVLDINGDWFDLLSLSTYGGIRSLNEKTVVDFDSELERGISLAKTMIKAVKPKRVHWKNGNHEFRFVRAFTRISDAAAKAIVNSQRLKHIYDYRNLFDFDSFGVKVTYAGDYPNGLWLHPTLPPDQNVWVEHGYIARKNSGYTATALVQERGTSVIVGHCERLALIWKHSVGDRNYFGIENGNLSLIGVPPSGGHTNGQGLYFGVPHSVPDFMNHQQGMSLLTHNGEWFPELIRISKGKAVYAGKTYKS